MDLRPWLQRVYITHSPRTVETVPTAIGRRCAPASTTGSASAAGRSGVPIHATARMNAENALRKGAASQKGPVLDDCTCREHPERETLRDTAQGGGRSTWRGAWGNTRASGAAFPSGARTLPSRWAEAATAPAPAKRHRAVLCNLVPFSGGSHVGPRRRQEAREAVEEARRRWRRKIRRLGTSRRKRGRS